MKLRNKRTGEIDDFIFDDIDNRIDLYRRVGSSDTKNIWHYNSLAELNEEWEDYKPKEPLIKNEKIRKAVKAWAEANGLDKLLVIKMAGRLEVSDGSPHLIYISFRADKETMSNLDDRTYYTIAELCGEGEE